MRWFEVVCCMCVCTIAFYSVSSRRLFEFSSCCFRVPAPISAPLRGPACGCVSSCLCGLSIFGRALARTMGAAHFSVANWGPGKRGAGERAS